LNLIEKATENTTAHPKRILEDPFPSRPKEDQYDVFVKTNNHWQSISLEGNKSTIFQRIVLTVGLKVPMCVFI